MLSGNNQLKIAGARDGGRPIMDVQLAKNVVHVAFNSSDTQNQPVGNFLIRGSTRDHGQNFPFTGRQMVEFGQSVTIVEVNAVCRTCGCGLGVGVKRAAQPVDIDRRMLPDARPVEQFRETRANIQKCPHVALRVGHWKNTAHRCFRLRKAVLPGQSQGIYQRQGDFTSRSTPTLGRRAQSGQERFCLLKIIFSN